MARRRCDNYRKVRRYLKSKGLSRKIIDFMLLEHKSKVFGDMTAQEFVWDLRRIHGYLENDGWREVMGTMRRCYG